MKNVLTTKIKKAPQEKVKNVKEENKWEEKVDCKETKITGKKDGKKKEKRK